MDQLDVQEKLLLWREIYISVEHQLLVYVVNDQVLGFLDGYLNPNNDVAEIRAFYLFARTQNQGIGRQMFKQFYSHSLSQSYAFIRLEVFNKNPSRVLYGKMGGKVICVAELPEFGADITELLYQWEL